MDGRTFRIVHDGTDQTRFGSVAFPERTPLVKRGDREVQGMDNAI
jgi:hypothetical protein